MKYKGKKDIGERVIVMFVRDVTDYLKELSKGTIINYFPEQFINLLNDNYDECIKSVKYCPKIYFYLNDMFKRDKYLIKMTLYSYKRHKKDKYIRYDKKEKIIKEKGKEEANRIADLIIKNTYRTLMTRGMKGCYVYCVDKKLEDHLKSLINML